MYHWVVNMPLQTIVDCFVDDVIGSQNRSKLWTPIALSIFELEHRPKAQNVTNAHGYHCSIFKFRYHFRLKNSTQPQNGGFLKMSKYKTQLQFDISNAKIIPNYARKNIFIVMTSSMTSQSDLKVVSLYSFINDKMTFFMITEERPKMSSSNLVHICIIGLWICVYKRSWNASLMTSSGPKISLNFELQ